MRKYIVMGMSCAACVARVEKAVSGVEGVTSCSVSLLTNSMGVEGTADNEEIIDAVRKAGYDAEINIDDRNNNKNNDKNVQSLPEEELLKDRDTPFLKKRLIISAIFLLVLMYVSMGHMMWGWPLPSFFNNNHVAMGILQLLLTFVIMEINQHYFISGFKSLWHFAPNMDSLVALGATAAFGYSTFAIFAMTDAQAKGDIDAVMTYMHEIYFESAAMILTLITLGKMLEARSKGKTTDALKGLMRLAPKTATVVRDNREITVPVAQVVKGDVFVVRPGENIPVDGNVIEGNSAVNESTLTGESIPADKAEGSTVSAGTMNQSGFLRCVATRVGEDTTLSQIIRLVSDAATTKAPIAKVADKVAGVFVPTVILISIITVAGWLMTGQTIGFALARGISVLVISCPCALGLATPVAIMVGNGIGAKNGILFKTAVSLEKTGKAQIVALDKTGTITNGEPSVTDIVPINAKDEKELLAAAYALEIKSEHPLARAIVRKAEEEGMKVSNVVQFKILPGNGLTGIMNGEVLLGGSYKYVSEYAKISDEERKRADKLSEEGKTPIYFIKNDKLLGIIAVADIIKEDSPAAIREMHKMGMKVVMLTGDNALTAEKIGAKAGVDEVIAGVLPGEKEEVIQKLKQKGNVIMVGDGINDAPALTSADIGIAIGAGADIAIDAADVVLMKSRLSDVPTAIRLSRATLRNIHENLFWAFIYNTIGIPLAAGVFINILGWKLNPMFAAAAMSMSSFCVITNALRLNLFNINNVEKNKKSTKETGIMEKTLKIEGMMCEHCEMHVKKALETLDGVNNAVVSHKSGSAIVELSVNVPDDILKQAVIEQGYKVTEVF